MEIGNTAIAIIGLAIWPILLVIGIAAMRTTATMTQGRDANSFATDGDDLSPLSGRLCRAHANCYEFIPFVLALLLFAIATDQTAVTDGLALVMLGARIAQSAVHIMSKSNAAVSLRFVFFLVQIGIALFWAAKFTFLHAG